jgi:hypothetical protein
MKKEEEENENAENIFFYHFKQELHIIIAQMQIFFKYKKYI